jgi:hypothetical protein
MPQAGSLATSKLMGVLRASGGLPETVADLSAQQNLSLAAIAAQQIIPQNVAPEFAERSTVSKYPLIYAYCGKLVNQLREKFRAFSGDAEMVVEARVSEDRLEDMETQVQLYVDAITQVLDASRGDWGDGVFYGGGYEVAYGGVKHGGRNFIQIAKVSFTLEISSD